MDGKRWIPNGLQLEIERLSEKDLLDKHMHYIKECMKHDLWKDITQTHEYKMRDLLHQEILIRRDAQ